MKIKDLPNGWQNTIMSLASEGAGIAEIINEIGISYKKHKFLMKEEEQYLACFEEAKLVSEAWWMKEGRSNLNNKNYNNTMWIFNMKNRFAWRDQPLLEKASSGSAFDDIREADMMIAKYQTKEVKKSLEQTDNIN